MGNKVVFGLSAWGGERHPVRFQIEPEYGLYHYRQIVRKELVELNYMIDHKRIGIQGERFALPPLSSPVAVTIDHSDTHLLKQTAKTPRWGNRYPQRKKPDPLKKVLTKLFPKKLLSSIRRHFRDFTWILSPPKERIRGNENVVKAFHEASHFLCLAERFWLANKKIISTYFPEDKRTILTQMEAPVELSDALAVPLRRFNSSSLEGWLRCRNSCNIQKILLVLYENQLDQVVKLLENMGLRDINMLVVACEQSIENNNSTIKVDKRFALHQVTRELTIGDSCEEDEIDSWPKITVVIISYNQVAFIRECIESVLGQSYPNLECIVVDGQSTDGTDKILKEFESRLQHLIIEPDRCQSDGLNKGFRLATGEMMTWLCSDDLLEDGALRHVARAFMKHRPDMVAGGCRIVNAEGNYICNHHNGYPVNELSRLSFGDLLSFTGVWERGMCFYQPDVFFSKALWESSGGYIKEHLHFAMDYDLFLRFAMAGARIIHIPEFLARRRVHKDQKTQHETMSYLPTLRNLMQEYQIMLDSIPLND